MPTPDWDPAAYEAFRSERSQPFFELLGLMREPEGLRDAVDLGCGTGELTAFFASTFPDVHVVGIDFSPAMLAKAEVRATNRLSFQLGDLAGLTGEWDLILSNAALQWVPDHAALIPHLYARLKPQGQLLVQVPTNQTHPSQTLMATIASEEPYVSALGGWTKEWSVLDLHGYGALLHTLGGDHVVLIEKLFSHVLADAAAMAHWVESTAMRPYLERMPDTLRQSFIDALIARLRLEFPGSPVFFGFKRLFFAIRRPGD